MLFLKRENRSGKAISCLLDLVYITDCCQCPHNHRGKKLVNLVVLVNPLLVGRYTIL